MACPPWPASDPYKARESASGNGSSQELPVPSYPSHKTTHKVVHCVLCRSHVETVKFFESTIGRKPNLRIIWLKRPVCLGCGQPWVAICCTGGHS